VGWGGVIRVCVKNKIPKYINMTRRKFDIHVKRKSTEAYKKSVINMGTRLYNKLPRFLKK